MRGLMFPKPTRTASRSVAQQKRAEARKHEREEKAAVRLRDRRCRFPLCACRLSVKPILEVAHTTHKGMGGNPAGDRSDRRTMVLLCRQRHQDGEVSLHKGTLRVVFQDQRKGFEGHVDWQVRQGSRWVTVAREQPNRAALLVTAPMW